MRRANTDGKAVDDSTIKITSVFYHSRAEAVVTSPANNEHRNILRGTDDNASDDEDNASNLQGDLPPELVGEEPGSQRANEGTP